jgi:hypothetical protein
MRPHSSKVIKKKSSGSNGGMLAQPSKQYFQAQQQTSKGAFM